MKIHTLTVKHTLLFLLLNPIFIHTTSQPGKASKEQKSSHQQQIKSLKDLAKELVHQFSDQSIGKISRVMEHLDLLLADLPLLEAIDQDDQDTIKKLIKSKKGDVNAPDMRGPFLQALKRYNFDSKDLPELLQYCLKLVKQKQKTLSSAEIQEIKKKWYGFTPIMKAAAVGDLSLVALYATEGADFMRSIYFDPFINMKDLQATINGRALASALERDIDEKLHTFEESDKSPTPERCWLFQAFVAGADIRSDGHKKNCTCCGTHELIKWPNALQLAAIGGHTEIVYLLLDAIISSHESIETKFDAVHRALYKLLPWSMVAQYLDASTARRLYENSGIPILPKTVNYPAIMRLLVKNYIGLWNMRTGMKMPVGLQLIPDALKCGTPSMLRAICEILAQEKLSDREKRRYDRPDEWRPNLVYSINNVEKLAVLLASDQHREDHRIPYRIGLALLRNARENPILLYALKEHVRKQLTTGAADTIPKDLAHRICTTSNHTRGNYLGSDVHRWYGKRKDLSALTVGSLRSLLHSCMSPFIYENCKPALRRLLMDGNYKSLGIKQIINEELAHRPIDITTQRGHSGVPFFNYFDDELSQKQSTMFLLSPGEPAVRQMGPAVYQLCHPRFTPQGLKDPQARTELFMRGLQQMRNSLNECLGRPELSNIVEEYASLNLPPDVIQHVLEADDEQLMLQERILTLPKQCQQRIAQLYIGSRKYAAKLASLSSPAKT